MRKHGAVFCRPTIKRHAFLQCGHLAKLSCVSFIYLFVYYHAASYFFMRHILPLSIYCHSRVFLNCIDFQL